MPGVLNKPTTAYRIHFQITDYSYRLQITDYSLQTTDYCLQITFKITDGKSDNSPATNYYWKNPLKLIKKTYPLPTIDSRAS